MESANISWTFPFNYLKFLSNKDMEKTISILYDELLTRYREKFILEETKDEIFSILLNLKSKQFFVDSSLLSSSLESKNYTPRQANQLSMALLFKNCSQLSEESQKSLDVFARKFWCSCNFQSNCFEKVSLDEVKLFYERNLKLIKVAKNNEVSGALLNCLASSGDSKSHGSRTVYDYSVGGVPVCKSFFCFVYDLTDKQLRKLQMRIRKGKNFDVNINQTLQSLKKDSKI